MNLKKFVSSLLIIFLILATGCSKQVLLDESNAKLLNYDFKLSDLKNIDKSLSNQKYSYSTNIDNKYVAVINYQFKKASIKQYLIKNDGIVDLTINKDSPFVISLPANTTITCTWNIKNSINKGMIKFESRSWIEIPLPKSKKGSAGDNYDRQNFYFRAIQSGSEKIVMRYEHQTIKNNEFFEITFNIIIE